MSKRSNSLLYYAKSFTSKKINPLPTQFLYKYIKTSRLASNPIMSRKLLNHLQLLPTLKRIAFEEEQQAYPQIKAKRENGLILKQKITSLKIKQLVATFSRKLRRNLTTSAPVEFVLENPIERDNSRWLKWKGLEVEEHLEGVIVFLDIVMSIACLIISAYQGFLTDFRIQDCTSPTVVSLKAIAIFIFAIRVLMGMVTVDYQNDYLYVYVTDIIIKQLLGGGIIIRLFSLFMVVTSLLSPGSQSVGIIFFFASVLELFLVKQNLRILQLLFINSIHKFYIWNLFRVVIFDIIFGHLIAVALLAISNINPENNWVTVKLVNNNFIDPSLPWYKLYIWSYYWACTIMMTVGFGDMSPVQYREAIFIAFLQIFSSIVLAYNISEVGSIVSKMRNTSQTLQRRIGVLRRMGKKNPVPEELGWKIESYLSHQTEIRDKFQYNEHRAIIDTLPQQLKQEYFLEENQELYRSLPVFRHFQKQTHARLNKAFEGRVYYPGEHIIRHKAEFNKLIIMRMGQFDLTYWKPQSELNGTVVQTIHITEKENHGILATNNILSRTLQLNYDIVAKKYSYGMQLKFDAFIAILQQNSLDYYFYRSVLDKHEKEINTYGYVRCEYCENEYHTRFQCTRLHYIPIKSEVFHRSKNSRSIPVQRSSRPQQQKIFVRHAYQLRSKLFSILQGLLVSTNELLFEEQLVLDVPYDFSMYFKENNPEMLRRIHLNRSRASYLSERSKHRYLKRSSINEYI